MTMEIKSDNITPKMIYNYFDTLVNRVFKILPIKESGEKSLAVYVDSLNLELRGFSGLSNAINDDQEFVTLLSILQFFADNCDETDVKTIRREVFRAIGVCNSIKNKHGSN